MSHIRISRFGNVQLAEPIVVLSYCVHQGSAVRIYCVLLCLGHAVDSILGRAARFVKPY